jgi:hypothetical protein
MEKKESKFIDKCYIREKIFEDGGAVLNCAFGIDELNKLADSNGWVNITISKRRSPSDNGKTHYAKHDDYKRKEEDLPF